MQCIFCKKSIPIFRRLKDAEFCSDDHRRQYMKEQSIMAMERLLGGRSGENTRVHRGSSSLKELAKTTLAESKQENATDTSAYSAALESAHHMAGSGAHKTTTRSGKAVRDFPPDQHKLDSRERVEDSPSDDLLFDALTSMNTDPEPISQPSSVLKTKANNGSTVWQVPPGASNEPEPSDESPSDELLFDALAELASPPPQQVIAAPPPTASRSSKVLLKPTVSNLEHDVISQFFPIAVLGKPKLIQGLEFSGFSAQVKFAPLKLGAVLRRKRCGPVEMPVSEGQLRNVQSSLRGLSLPLSWQNPEPWVPSLNLAFEHNLTAPPPPIAGSAAISFPIFGRAGTVANSTSHIQFQSWQKVTESLPALQFGIESHLQMPPPPVFGPVDRSIFVAPRSLQAHQPQLASEETAIPSAGLLVFRDGLQSKLELQVAEAGEVPLSVEPRIACWEWQAADPLTWPNPQLRVLSLTASIESDLKMPPPPVAGPLERNIFIASRSLKQHQLKAASEEWKTVAYRLLSFNGPLSAPTGLALAGTGDIQFDLRFIHANNAAPATDPLTWGILEPGILSLRAMIESDLKMPPPPIAGPRDSSIFIAARSLKASPPKQASAEWAIPYPWILPFSDSLELDTGFALAESGAMLLELSFAQISVGLQTTDPLVWGLPQPRFKPLQAVVESDLKLPPPSVSGLVEQTTFIAARGSQQHLLQPASHQWTVAQPSLLAFNDNLELHTGFALAEETDCTFFDLSVFTTCRESQTTSTVQWPLQQPRIRPLRAFIESDLEVPPPPVSGLAEWSAVIASRSLQGQQTQTSVQQWTISQPSLLPFNDSLELSTGFALAEETDFILFDLSFVTTNGEAPTASTVQWPLQQPRVLPLRAVIESDLEIPPPPVSGLVDWSAVITSRNLQRQQEQASAQQWTILFPSLLAFNNNLELHTGFGLTAETDTILFDLSFVEPVLEEPAASPLPWALRQPKLRQLSKLAEDEPVESNLDAPPFAGSVENTFLPSIQNGKEPKSVIEHGEPTYPIRNFFTFSPVIESSVGPGLVEQQFTLAVFQAKPAPGNLQPAELNGWLPTTESSPRFAAAIKRYRTVPALPLAGLDDCEPFLPTARRDSGHEQNGAMRSYFMRPAICPPDLLGIGSKSLYIRKTNGLVVSKTILSLDLTGEAIPLRVFATNSLAPISIEAGSLLAISTLAIEPELDWESIQQIVKKEAIPPFADLVSLPVVKNVKYSRAKANATSVGLVQVLVEGKKPSSGLSVEPFKFNERSVENSLRSSLEQKKPSAGFSLFWLKAPADLKWIMLSLPVIIGVWLYTSAGTPKKPVEPVAVPMQVVEMANPKEPAYDAYAKPSSPITSEQAEAVKEETPLRATPPQISLGGQAPDQADSWEKFKQRVAFRAAISHEEDFHSGLSQWAGRKGWANTWSYDKTGLARVGQLALFTPSMSMIDYHFELTASLDRHSMGWVFRSLDLNNYYAGRLVITRPGPVPTVSLERYAVIEGRKMKSQFIPVPITHRGDSIFTISVDVAGNSFTTSVQGQIVDSFTDDKFKFGGVGLFSGRGEESRVFRVSLTHNNDAFGRLCALIAPYETISSGSVKK